MQFLVLAVIRRETANQLYTVGDLGCSGSLDPGLSEHRRDLRWFYLRAWLLVHAESACSQSSRAGGVMCNASVHRAKALHWFFELLSLTQDTGQLPQLSMRISAIFGSREL